MTKPASKRTPLGDVPIGPMFRNWMNSLARVLDEALNDEKKGDDRTVGFILITFMFNDDSGRTNYISNADRDSVVAMLKHQIARFEGQPDVGGNA